MAAHKRQSANVKQISVPMGLHLMRYLSASDVNDPPEIELKARKRDEVDLIDPRGRFSRRLDRPGDFLIIRAGEDVVLDVISEPSVPRGSIAANLSFQKLDASVFRGAERVAQPQLGWDDEDERGMEPDQPAALEVLGHLARRGDVVVGEGEWLGGPESPFPIEGIQIRWPDRPEGVSLGYEVRRREAESGRLQGLGAFAGSRGRARPLKFLHLELTGSQASRYVISAAALFLGSPIKNLQGRTLSFEGATGTEPLVGFKFSVMSAAAVKDSSRVAAAVTGRRPREVSSRDEGVRVFRRSNIRGKADER